MHLYDRLRGNRFSGDAKRGGLQRKGNSLRSIRLELCYSCNPDVQPRGAVGSGVHGERGLQAGHGS